MPVILWGNSKSSDNMLECVRCAPQAAGFALERLPSTSSSISTANCKCPFHSVPVTQNSVVLPTHPMLTISSGKPNYNETMAGVLLSQPMRLPSTSEQAHDSRPGHEGVHPSSTKENTAKKTKTTNEHVQTHQTCQMAQFDQSCRPAVGSTLIGRSLAHTHSNDGNNALLHFRMARLFCATDFTGYELCPIVYVIHESCPHTSSKKNRNMCNDTAAATASKNKNDNESSNTSLTSSSVAGAVMRVQRTFIGATTFPYTVAETVCAQLPVHISAGGITWYDMVQLAAPQLTSELHHSGVDVRVCHERVVQFAPCFITAETLACVSITPQLSTLRECELFLYTDVDMLFRYYDTSALYVFMGRLPHDAEKAVINQRTTPITALQGEAERTTKAAAASPELEHTCSSIVDGATTTTATTAAARMRKDGSHDVTTPVDEEQRSLYVYKNTPSAPCKPVPCAMPEADVSSPAHSGVAAKNRPQAMASGEGNIIFDKDNADADRCTSLVSRCLFADAAPRNLARESRPAWPHRQWDRKPAKPRDAKQLPPYVETQSKFFLDNYRVNYFNNNYPRPSSRWTNTFVNVLSNRQLRTARAPHEGVWSSRAFVRQLCSWRHQFQQYTSRVSGLTVSQRLDVLRHDIDNIRHDRVPSPLRSTTVATGVRSSSICGAWSLSLLDGYCETLLECAAHRVLPPTSPSMSQREHEEGEKIHAHHASQLSEHTCADLPLCQAVGKRCLRVIARCVSAIHIHATTAMQKSGTQYKQQGEHSTASTHAAFPYDTVLVLLYTLQLSVLRHCGISAFVEHRQQQKKTHSSALGAPPTIAASQSTSRCCRESSSNECYIDGEAIAAAGSSDARRIQQEALSTAQRLALLLHDMDANTTGLYAHHRPALDSSLLIAGLYLIEIAALIPGACDLRCELIRQATQIFCARHTELACFARAILNNSDSTYTRVITAGCASGLFGNTVSRQFDTCTHRLHEAHVSLHHTSLGSALSRHRRFLPQCLTAAVHVIDMQCLPHERASVRAVMRFVTRCASFGQSMAVLPCSRPMSYMQHCFKSVRDDASTVTERSCPLFSTSTAASAQLPNPPFCLSYTIRRLSNIESVDRFFLHDKLLTDQLVRRYA